MKIEPEDFKAWLDNPVTEVVLKKLREQAESIKELWLHECWNANEWDQIKQTKHRAEAQMLFDIANMTYEGLINED